MTESAGAAGAISVLQRNVSASYISQVYAAAIGIVMVPLYVRYMGTEAYGLIGLFAILQVCIQALDLGITPTLAREATRTIAGKSTPLALRQLIRAFEVVFIGFGICVIFAMAAGTHQIATAWIKPGQISPLEIETSLILMAAAGWLRWFAGLYRGVVNGFEKQVWQSIANIGVATAHSVAVIPFLIYVGASPVYFFSYQLGVSVLEWGLAAWMAYRLLPNVGRGESVWWRFGSVSRVFHFSVVVALTSTMWVAVTQTDKLVLSRILSLSDFGVFALATVVAGGVTSLNAPLSTALLPRLTALSARGDEDQFRSVYKGATQFTAVVCFSAALFLALFAEKVLWAWTGNLKIAENAALTLQLYALGNGLAAFGAFPYYLQYARGNVSLHLIGTLLYLSLLLPGVIVLARYFGTTGAGVAWLSVNTLFLLAWVPVVHYRFLGRFHARWLFFDIAPVALTTAVVGMILKTSVRWPDGRALTVAILMASGAIICASGAAASPAARGLIVGAVRRQFGSRRS